MTKELTKEYLQELGFIKVYNWFGTWHIYRYWYKTDGKTKELKLINVRNAKCRHKFTQDKYYPIISFSIGHSRNKSLTLSKFLYAWFKGTVPAGYDVDHIDNDPFNNDLDNLQLLTRKENIAKRLVDNPDSWINQYGQKKEKNDKDVEENKLY